MMGGLDRLDWFFIVVVFTVCITGGAAAVATQDWWAFTTGLVLSVVMLPTFAAHANNRRVLPWAP